MPKASPTPPVKEALEEMGKAEDEVKFFLRQATILLAPTQTATSSKHLPITPPSSSSTRSKTGLRATSESLDKSVDRYEEKSHELGNIIKEEGWDDASWPKLHNKSLQDARERLGREVDKAIIKLDARANMRETWGEKVIISLDQQDIVGLQPLGRYRPPASSTHRHQESSVTKN